MIALIAYSLLIAGSASGLALLVSGFIVIHGAVLWPMWISFPLCTLLGVLLSGSDVGRTGALHLVGTFLGLVGIAGLFGVVDGTPRYAPVNMCDRIVGLYVANAIMAALVHKARDGQGQAIEVPMFETMAQFVLADHMGGHAFSPPLGPAGYARILASTRGPYPTKDGFLSLVVYTDKHWRSFTALVGCPDLLDRDARFATPQNRNMNAEETGKFLTEHLPARTNAEWLAALTANDIPASPVNALQDLFDDPHLGEVGLFETMEHPTEGAVNVTHFPVVFSETPAEIRRLAPALGAHNREVLGGDPNA